MYNLISDSTAKMIVLTTLKNQAHSCTSATVGDDCVGLLMLQLIKLAHPLGVGSVHCIILGWDPLIRICQLQSRDFEASGEAKTH